MSKSKKKSSSSDEVLANRLGRLKPKPDPKDKRFLISAVIPKRIVGIDSRYWYAGGWWGNQGDQPHCVGYSLVHLLEDGPITQGGPSPCVDPSGLYKLAQRVDEWPGEDYDGTSVRAGAKVLQTMGFFGDYRWAWDLNTMINCILTTGPVVVGTNWYWDMFYPDAKGLIKIGGGVAGGHAYKIDGINMKKKEFRIKQSWSREWGVAGFGRISFENMEQLIAEDGEVCLAREIKKIASGIKKAA